MAFTSGGSRMHLGLAYTFEATCRSHAGIWSLAPALAAMTPHVPFDMLSLAYCSVAGRAARFDGIFLNLNDATAAWTKEQWVTDFNSRMRLSG